MQELTADFAPKYYDSHPGDTDKPILFLIHGTMGSTASHYGFMFPILAHRYRVVSIDFQDTDTEQLELQQLVEQSVNAIKGACPGQKVHVLGYSLGAVVAAEVAAHHPELVDQLVLVCGWAKTDLQQQLRNDVWFALRESGNEDALKRYVTFCGFGGPFLSELTFAMIEPTLKNVIFNEFGDRQMDLNRRVDISDSIGKIRAQTLVIGCTHDVMVPLHHQRRLFGGVEKASFAEISSGHGVVFERPSEIVNHVQHFIDNPERFAAGAIIPTPQP